MIDDNEGWSDEEEAAADADLDVLPGAPKMTAEQAREYVTFLTSLCCAFHTDGLMATDAIKKGEESALKVYPNASPLSKKTMTAILKHVMTTTTRGRK